MNPSLIWHTDGQTYASSKDNARALYADTLAPLLNMYENVLNAFLLPMVGEQPSTYAEFDLEAKLAGSFEERASVMQSAVGGPWMTRNEARAKLNMPAIDGADDLIVPLNVTEGGLAAPNDTDPTVERHNAAPHFAKAGDAAPFADGAATVVLKSRAVPPEALVDEISDTLARHVRRQVARVTADLAKSAASGAKAVPGDLPEWWDAARWDRELADDLEPILRRIVDQRGMAALADIGEDVSGWDPGRVAAFVRSMAELRARRFNGGTLDAALDVLGDGSGDEVVQVADAILARAEGPAEAAARTYAIAASGFATKEAVRQVYPRDTDSVRRTKTWRHHPSRQPRSDHAAMDGETVGLDERFSNGADYPGDWTHGPANNVNCHCTMDVAVEKGRAQFNLVDDGRVRYEDGTTEASLPEGAIDSMAKFADEFNAKYPALAAADGTVPLGLSGVTVCDTAGMAAEAGAPLSEVTNASGMFHTAGDGIINAGIYLNADILASGTAEQALSDFRHEYGHYVGWFIERSGAGSVEGMVRETLDKLEWDAADATLDMTGALIIGDLSRYAGESWIEGKSGEVFAEAFRVWQEGGESRIAAILGPMIDAALRGLG